MSNADDNQGRRGLFRRNRSEEPVASTQPPAADNANPEFRTEPAADTERKQSRRPGIGRRKAATDGSWSSDVWEDGWDDDWSDRSSRAGVRPAADPRPAEVDAWLASSDDQLGDITRDIARKWTGNKQPNPINAAITWADDVPALPSSALANDAFAGDPFVSGVLADSVSAPSSFASDENLWDSPSASSNWNANPNDLVDPIDPIDPIDFEPDDLPPVQNSAAHLDLGSTWDDFGPSIVTESAQHTAEPIHPSESMAIPAFTEAVDEAVDPTDDEQSATANDAAVLSPGPLQEIALKTNEEMASLLAVPEIEETQAPTFALTGDLTGDLADDLADPPEVSSEMGFDFGGSTNSIEAPENDAEKHFESLAAVEQETPLESAVESTWNTPIVENIEAPVSEALAIETPLPEVLVPEAVAPEALVPEVLAPEAVETPLSTPVERDEFLESLYEELDDGYVPAGRKFAHQEVTAQLASTVAPHTGPKTAGAPIVEHAKAVNPAPIVEDAATFAPITASLDRSDTETLASPSEESAQTEHAAGSPAAEIAPQDPSDDFNFGPDRPVYAPNVATIPVSVSAPVTAARQPALDDVDDLFPPTKADRFGTALDQLNDDQSDDQTHPSGLQEPATKRGFLRGRKSRNDTEDAPLPAPTAELDQDSGHPSASHAAASALIIPTVAPDKMRAGGAVASVLRDGEDFDDQDELAELDEYDDLEAYQEEAYFSPKLTKLLSRAGFLVVALAAIRMLVLVGVAIKDGAKDALGTQDIFHRIGNAFAELGFAHGLMLIMGIAMAATPALLGDPYLDDESRSIGATFGIGLIAAVFGVFGGFAAARLALRVNDISELTNPGLSSTTKWAKVAMNLVATAGLSLVAVIAAIRALAGDRQDLN